MADTRFRDPRQARKAKLKMRFKGEGRLDAELAKTREKLELLEEIRAEP